MFFCYYVIIFFIIVLLLIKIYFKGVKVIVELIICVKVICDLKIWVNDIFLVFIVAVFIVLLVFFNNIFFVIFVLVGVNDDFFDELF